MFLGDLQGAEEMVRCAQDNFTSVKDRIHTVKAVDHQDELPLPDSFLVTSGTAKGHEHIIAPMIQRLAISQGLSPGSRPRAFLGLPRSQLGLCPARDLPLDGGNVQVDAP